MARNMLDINKDMFTLVVKGKPIAFVGVIRFRKGVGELWLMPGHEVDNHKWGFFKTIKCLIYEVLFNQGYHRLEIAILKGWTQGEKWARALGFEYQGVVKAYDHRYRDHSIFYRIKEQ